MDEHLRFCKRTYKNDLPNRVGAGLNFVEGRIENPEEGDLYYDHEEQASYVFVDGDWALFAGIGNGV